MESQRRALRKGGETAEPLGHRHISIRSLRRQATHDELTFDEWQLDRQNRVEDDRRCRYRDGEECLMPPLGHVRPMIQGNERLNKPTDHEAYPSEVHLPANGRKPT